MTLAQPVQIAEPALGQEFERRKFRQRPKMRIGEVGQNVHQELPIAIPAMKTSAPPTMTWNAAERKGVSM